MSRIVIYLNIFMILVMTWDLAAPERSVQSPLHVGAFNIQKLGNSKMSNTKVMNIVKQILLWYDLVLIQEIVTTDERSIQNLLTDLNKLSNSSRYSMVISKRLGRDRAKEQYAYFYKQDRLKVIKEEAYPDVNDDFMRPPYIVQFASNSLGNLKTLLAIGIHTQPKNAANETSAMAAVYDYASQKFKEKNAIMMGDMNAGCQNVRIGDWPNIELWTREEFDWLISHDIDTTVSDNCCPYDRMVIAGFEMKEAVLWDSIHVFNFRNAYGLSTEEALEVSDHWPIGVLLRGGVSEDARTNVNTRLCLEASDLRKRSLPSELEKQKTTMGFQITRSDSLTMLNKLGKDVTSLLTDLEKLSSKYPDFISQEIFDTISYKVNHEALRDNSSSQKFTDKFSVDVNFNKASQTISVNFCSDSSIN